MTPTHIRLKLRHGRLRFLHARGTGAALKIQAAGTLPSLKDTWLSIPPALRKELAAEKDAHKRDIEEANAQLLKDTQP